MADRSLADISEKLRYIDFALLSTVTGSGAIAARPMSNNREVEYDGTSWFFTCDESGTAADIGRNPQVGLGYQAKSGILGVRPFFVSIEGRAEPIRDKALFADHWTKGPDRWFEQGIDTPGLVLIKVTAERLHYWDGYDEGELRLSERAEA